jgi:hypothetical protein
MSGPSGIGKPPPSGGEGEVGEVRELEAMKGKGGGGEDIPGLLHAKVSTLRQLKDLLIQHLGEKQGTKFFNQFVMSSALMMLQQVRASAEQARKAAQEMRMDENLR